MVIEKKRPFDGVRRIIAKIGKRNLIIGAAVVLVVAAVAVNWAVFANDDSGYDGYDVSSGMTNNMGATETNKDEDFFSLKGIIEAICQLSGAHTQYERSSEPYLHPGRQALVKANNTPCAVFGELHPTVAATYGIDTKVYIAEIKLDVLLGINKRKTVYKPLPKFPAVERDFAMLCDSDIPVGNLEKAISQGAGRLLEKIELFDIYQGAQIPAGKKSVAFSVYLRSADSTLTDKEIEETSNKIIKKLESIGAELRK